MTARYLDPTNDVAFKKLFNNKELLISLLNSILKLTEGNRIKELDYIPVKQMPLFSDGNRSIFDLKVKDEAERWYIIEMQRKTEKKKMLSKGKSIEEIVEFTNLTVEQIESIN